MKYLHELKEKLCEELQEIAEKQDMSAGASKPFTS